MLSPIFVLEAYEQQTRAPKIPSARINRRALPSAVPRDFNACGKRCFSSDLRFSDEHSLREDAHRRPAMPVARRALRGKTVHPKEPAAGAP